MYFEDLTKYRYQINHSLDKVRNIGWLDQSHSFRTGNTDPLITRSLTTYYDVLITNQARGYHYCQFCSADDPLPTVQVGDQSVQLGAAELWIPDDKGSIWATPDLIIHYIDKHSYNPPEEFLDAVRRLPATTVGWNSTSTADELCKE